MFEEVVEFECYFKSLLRGFGLIIQPLVFRGFFRIEGRKEGGIALLNTFLYHSFGLKVGVFFSLSCLFVIVFMFPFTILQIHVCSFVCLGRGF